MNTLKSVKDIDLAGRKVLLRLDLNAPLKDGEVSNDARLRAALPTIKYVLEHAGAVALASHLGRPKGKVNPDFSLEPVGRRLSELLEKEVLLADNCIGDSVAALLADARPNSVILLENLRFHAGETKNDPEFARKLAAPFDVYINDAFGACHRSHGSITGVVSHVTEAAAGFLVQKEVEALSTLLHGEERPFVAIVGGAKVSDKIGVLNALMKRVDTVCIGGAMAYTFLQAREIKVGSSRVEEDQLRVARDILENARLRKVKFLLPVDHTCARNFDEGETPVLVADEHIGEGLMGLDIGPKTRELYVSEISGAKRVLWNGPMGVFEWDQFATGTNTVGEAVAQSDGYTVVGGGDSVAAVEKAGLEAQLSHVSTGGGASLEFIENDGALPGTSALSA